MPKIICSRCKVVYDTHEAKCPSCGLEHPHVYNFENSDDYLKKEVPRILEERKNHGLEGLVGGLECVLINTEPGGLLAAAQELMNVTGLEFSQAFEGAQFKTIVLKSSGSADFLVRSRKQVGNPFADFNTYPKSGHLPNTRLETFVFGVNDIAIYHSIQKARGTQFLTNDVVDYGGYSFIQTAPSDFTGNSLGFIQWQTQPGDYTGTDSNVFDVNLKKPALDFLQNIKELDHAATRVEALSRDAAIIEFMDLTNYNFDFSIYVKLFNSITNVARLSADDYAMVFTSGIASYVSDEISGPTEKFVHNYGPRVHHIAFRTERIESTFSGLKEHGMGFLIDLVGSPDEGLRQTFSTASEHTLLVNEYIERYGNFEGFFTRSNVTLLTGSTDQQ